MNRPRAKEEVPVPAPSSSFAGDPPAPMEGLHETGPPPFLTKTYEIIEDSATDHIVSWSRGNNSFVVWDPQSFALSLLPKYFKHSNFSSFVRQLNTYGFRKVDPDKWEFAHEGFLRGQKHLLKLITRRKTQQPNSCRQPPDPCVELGRFGLDGEVDRLRRDKHVLMAELVKLRLQQQNTKTYLQTMEQRLKKTELKQQMTMNFLARAIQNPDFVQNLMQQKVLGEAMDRKRRRHIDFPGTAELRAVKVEPESIYGAMDVDFIGVQMQEMSENKGGGEEEVSERGRDVDDGFWENLLNEANEEEFGVQAGFDEQEDDQGDGDELVDQFRFL